MTTKALESLLVIHPPKAKKAPAKKAPAKKAPAKKAAPKKAVTKKTTPKPKAQPKVIVLTDPVGIVEIAERLDVSRVTVDKWIQREWVKFPEEDAMVGGRPAWNWETIRAWAEATDRL